jgi:hypothetical protein
LTGVGEVTFSQPPGQGSAPAACGLDLPGTGLLTNYTYGTSGGPQMTITQGGLEQRVSIEDTLGRIVSATNPESGSGPAGP